MPWFEVTADRFDWMPNKNVVIRYPKGGPHHGTRACVDAGEKAGKVKRMAKAPKGWKVGKDGVPYRKAVTFEDGSGDGE